jgi:hypothetical protein
MTTSQYETAPENGNEGKWVSFDTKTGFLSIEGFDGLTTLSKDGARKLAAALLQWSNDPIDGKETE